MIITVLQKGRAKENECAIYVQECSGYTYINSPKKEDTILRLELPNSDFIEYSALSFDKAIIKNSGGKTLGTCLLGCQYKD